MTLGVDQLRATVCAAVDAIDDLEQELNEADAKLGDGDTGGMLARLLHSMKETSVPPDADLGEAFRAYAKAATLATGSSLGTLLATALMTCAKETKGQRELALADLGKLLSASRDSMMARGGAKLGDKTVLDALDAVACAVTGLSDPEAMSEAARRAGREALEHFRGRPNQVGRARMFADRTVGLDDPGMLAFVKLCEAVTAPRESHSTT